MKTQVELDPVLRKLEHDLGAEVEKLSGETGRDWVGDPAVWVWVLLSASAPKSVWSRENLDRITSAVTETVHEAGLPGWVYVRFRDAAEPLPSGA